MNENDNWFNRQLHIAARATEKWPEWMKREAGISQVPSAPHTTQTAVNVAPNPNGKDTSELMSR